MTIAAVLAGGASRRMGRSKPGVLLGGRPLIERPIAAAAAAGLEPLVVAGATTELPPLACPVIREPEGPRHPLRGVVTALDSSGDSAVVVLACDMPFVPSPLLERIGRLRPPAVVTAVGRLQPLLALYGPDDREALAGAAAGGVSARDAVAALNPRVIGDSVLARFGDPGWITFNVNSPPDLGRAEKRLRQ